MVDLLNVEKDLEVLNKFNNTLCGLHALLGFSNQGHTNAPGTWIEALRRTR
jgi:hypothetical protein